jgi:hypothetical protein
VSQERLEKTTRRKDDLEKKEATVWNGLHTS